MAARHRLFSQKVKKLTIFSLLFLLISPFAISQIGNERVFYSSYRPQGWDIWISDGLIGSLDQVTNQEALDYNPVISPDGKWIVFTSERLGNPNLFIQSLEEKSEARLLIDHKSSMQDQAVISPEGNWLVFTSTHEGQSDIYRLPFMPTDTLTMDEALNLTQDKGGDFRPSFSPDGSQIVFSSDRNHPIKVNPNFVFAMRRTSDIYSMTVDGTNLKRLTSNEEWDGSPTYSSDGKSIFFYSGPRNSIQIYSMNLEGENQEAISPAGMNAISPASLNDSILVFTTYQNSAFKLMSLNLNTNQVDSVYRSSSNFLGAKIHSNGTIAFYGGEPPVETAHNLGGFEGDILVKGSPHSTDLEASSVDMYGVRRAFAAPPNPNNSTMIFEGSVIRGITDAISPWAFAIPLILLIYLVILFLGNRNLKAARVKLGAYFAFNILAIVALVVLLIVVVFFYVIQATPINSMRMILGIVVLILALIVGLTYWKGKGVLSKQIRMIFLLNIGFIFYLLVTLPLLIQIPVQFYELNYETNEIKPIYKFAKPSSYNPVNGMVIDTKFNPDGGELLFGLGSFRGGPMNQGDVFSLDLNSYEVTKLTDSDFNDGFGDITGDNSKMVFRSGRSGFFDIYIKEGDEIKNLTSDEHRDNFPTISPQGNKIAFCSDRLGTDIEGRVKTMDIFLTELNSDGTWSEPKQLTMDKGQDAHPHFSPDGEWIIYTSEEGGLSDEEPLVQPLIFGPQQYGEIFAIHLSSGKKIRLTHNKWEDGAPLWTKGIQAK